MPRVGRWILPGTPLHVVQRGINRTACFFSEADYPTYLYFLRTAAARYECDVHAYCLMSNHVHLLLTPHHADACGAFMKHLSQCYVQSVNKRLERTGTLWEGRFRSCAVQSERYVLACYRYIELNPVRAGMVASAGDYPWSSYLENTGARANRTVVAHAAYESLASNPFERAATYLQLCADALPARDMDEIRKATKLGCAIGTRRRGPGRPSIPR